MVERGGVVFEGFEELDARWLWLLGGSLVRLDGDLRPSALYFAANFCYLPTRECTVVPRTDISASAQPSRVGIRLSSPLERTLCLRS